MPGVDISFTDQLAGVTVTLLPVDPITGAPVPDAAPIVLTAADDSFALQIAPVIKGAKGDQGDPGASSVSDFDLYEAVASSDGEQVYDLTAVPAGRVTLLINGLRQQSNAYSVTGQIATLPADLHITIGDLIQIQF